MTTRQTSYTVIRTVPEPGVVALTDARSGEGGFCSVPSLLRDRAARPKERPSKQGLDGNPYVAYEPDVRGRAVVEVRLRVGDLLIMDSKLPHGTVRNSGATPRVVFYVQLFPVGTPGEAAVRVEDSQAGRCPAWRRWKPGHHRIERGPLATLNAHGRRLLGIDDW